MTQLNVLIGEDIGAANVARLRAAFPAVTFHLGLEQAAFVAAAAQAEVIFSKSFPAESLTVAPKLRWVQAGTAGVERWLDLGLRTNDILLTNATGAHGIPMAEQMIAMMLAFATGLHTLLRAQDSRRRINQQIIREKFELAGQTVCVLGLGDIGGTLAYKCKQLDMHVLGVRRSGQPFPNADRQFTPDQLLDALPQADHVALCLPLTPDTTRIIGEAELRAMKSTAYIYNVGRGASIEANALLRALQEGWIAGAGLDVTDPEPLPPESPLWAMPTVILGQHTSGSSPFNADRITTIFQENLGRFLRDEPLQNVIDKSLGY